MGRSLKASSQKSEASEPSSGTQRQGQPVELQEEKVQWRSMPSEFSLLPPPHARGRHGARRLRWEWRPLELFRALPMEPNVVLLSPTFFLPVSFRGSWKEVFQVGLNPTRPPPPCLLPPSVPYSSVAHPFPSEPGTLHRGPQSVVQEPLPLTPLSLCLGG